MNCKRCRKYIETKTTVIGKWSDGSKLIGESWHCSCGWKKGRFS